MDPFRMGSGEFREPADLPEHQAALHRRIMRQVRAERPQRPQDRDDNGREWPGLTKEPDGQL